MRYRPLAKLKVSGKRVLVRVGFDVPMDGRGHIADTFRITRTLPTLRWLLNHGAKVVLLSHRGQPHGHRRKTLSLRPMAQTVSRLLRKPVAFTDLRPRPYQLAVEKLKNGQLLLVENLRFDPGEERCDRRFARFLAAEGDMYVNDDFSTSHRRHASIVLLPGMLPSAAGINLLQECTMLDRVRKNPRHPFVAIIGGGKVRDKLSVVKRLLRSVDAVLVGGAAATTFLSALHYKVGTSLIDEKVSAVSLRALARSSKVHLPSDVVVALSPTSTSGKVALISQIPNNSGAYDIGPATLRNYRGIIESARTVFWAGPLGYTENPVFSVGTKGVALHIPRRNIFAVAGGGDTLSTIHKAKLDRRFSYLSTGGSAMLMYLAGEPLPGLQALAQ